MNKDIIVLSDSIGDDDDDDSVFKKSRGDGAYDAPDDDDGDEGVISISEAIERLGFGRFQVVLMLMCGFYWACDAMEIILLSYLLTAVKDEWKLDDFWEATVASVVFAGIAVGSVLFGWIADKRGRRIVFSTSLLFTSVLGLAGAFAPNLAWLLVFRGLLGVALGGAPTAYSLFMEFVPNGVRAVVMVYFNLFWTLGSLVEAAIAWAVLPSLGWRWLLGISAIAPFLLTIVCLWVPESPRYDVVNGNMYGAQRTMERVARWNRKPITWTALQTSEVVPKGRVSDVLVPGLRVTTLLLWFLWAADTFAYYGVVLFSSNFLTELYGDNDSLLLIFLTTAAELAVPMGIAFFINRMGRKWTQCFLFGACAVCVFGLIPVSSQWPLVILCGLARSFIFGAFAVTYLYTPEVYPTVIRSVGLGMCAGSSKIAGIAAPYASNAFDGNDLLVPAVVYGSVSAIACIASAFLPLETTGKSLAGTLQQFKDAGYAIGSDNEHTPLMGGDDGDVDMT